MKRNASDMCPLPLNIHVVLHRVRAVLVNGTCSMHTDIYMRREGARERERERERHCLWCGKTR